MTTLAGHEGEIVSLHFNAEGDKILTGSFDRTAMVKINFNIIGRSGMRELATVFMY